MLGAMHRPVACIASVSYRCFPIRYYCGRLLRHATTFFTLESIISLEKLPF